MFGFYIMKNVIFFAIPIVNIVASSSLPNLSATLFCEKDHVYLNGSRFCDGYSQCTDGSDESYGCDVYNCGVAKFKCGDGSCKDIKVRCNSREDCVDGSDEFNCGDETNIEQCSLEEKKFLCQDKLKCLDFKFICDGVCNCFDCSDENNGCSVYDEYLCEACSNGCSSDPDDITNFSKSFSHAKADPECKDIDTFDPCGQKCFYYGQSVTFRCINDENYQLREISETSNNKCYHRVSFKNTLIYSTSNEIKMFLFATDKTSTIKTEVDCTALTAANDYVYCATYVNETGLILRISINSRDTYEVIKSGFKITSMAIDWITNNIYFTTNSSLSVCTNSGQYCTQLKTCIPCSSVSLAPKFGQMFWIDNNVIMKSAMDGSEENVFVRELEQNLIFLWTDELTDSVYWTHSSVPLSEGVVLKSMNFHVDPTSRNIRNLYVLKNDSFNFAVFENTVYYTKTNDSSIHYFRRKIDKDDNNIVNDFSILTKNKDASSVKFLYAYNPLLQRTKISNPCKFRPCSNLCLIRPLTTSKGLNYSCKRKNSVPNNIFRKV